MQSQDQARFWLTNVTGPLELVIFIFLFAVFVVIRKNNWYMTFPAVLFQWLLCLDMAHAFIIGPFRWIKGGFAYTIFAVPNTETGCQIAAILDNVMQVATVYTNTCIVTTVFIQVYYGRLIPKYKAAANNKKFLIGLCATVLVFGLITAFSGHVDNAELGWCVLDSSGLLGKHIFYYLCIMLQISMIIPIITLLYQSSQRSKTQMTYGAYLRFCGILVSQIIGFTPLFVTELLSMARLKVPIDLVRWFAIGYPLGHLIDGLVIGSKVLTLCKKTRQESKKTADTIKRMDLKYSDRPVVVEMIAEEEEEEIQNEKTVSTDNSSGDSGGVARAEMKFQDQIAKNNQNKGICTWWKIIPLSFHISLALIVPMFIFAVISSLELASLVKSLRETTKNHKNIDTINNIEMLVNELQNERYLQDTSLATYQYALTNNAWTHMLQELPQIGSTDIIGNENLARSLTLLYDLQANRESLENINNFHFNLNHKLINVLEDIGKTSISKNKIDSYLIAYINIIIIKERTAQTHALININLSTEAQNRRLIQLLADKEAHKARLLAMAPADIITDIELGLSNTTSTNSTLENLHIMHRLQTTEKLISDNLGSIADAEMKNNGALIVLSMFTVVTVIWINIILLFNVRERLWERYKRRNKDIKNNSDGCTRRIIKIVRLRQSPRGNIMTQVTTISTISLIASLTLLFIMLFTLTHTTQRYADSHASHVLENVINELQHERQLSIEFAMQRETAVRSDLHRQRRQTNTVIAQFNTVIPKLGRTDLITNHNFIEAVKFITEDLEATRYDIDAFALDPATIIDIMDEVIENHVVSLETLIRMSVSNTLYHRVYSFVSLSLFKERFGQEYTDGKLGHVDAFAKHIGESQAFLEQALLFADKEGIAAFKTTVTNTASYRFINRIHTAVLLGENIETTSTWDQNFKLQRAAITQVQDTWIDRLVTWSQHINKQQKGTVITLCSLFGVLLLLNITLVYNQVKSVMSTTKMLQQQIRRLRRQIKPELSRSSKHKHRLKTTSPIFAADRSPSITHRLQTDPLRNRQASS
jgi:hypothetical protein